jgi:ComF family protein
MLARLKKTILDYFFPIVCSGCGKEGLCLCEKCVRKIEPSANNICYLCNKNFSDLGICEICREKSSLDQIIVAVKFKNSVVEKAIHDLKYNFIEELAKILADLLSEKVIGLGLQNVFYNQTIIPIPLHKKRFFQRGFNQSQLIAQSFAKRLNCHVEKNFLARKKPTDQQAKLTRVERFVNIKEAFICQSLPDNIKSAVYLLDDVLTTGATLNEAARILKAAGAKKVIALAVAHE